MGYKFKQHKLSAGERIWLTELYKNRTEEVDINVLKVKLFGKLPEDFNPEKIGHPFINNFDLTLIGLWYVDPENKLFRISDKIIHAIKEIIIENPNIDSVRSTDLTKRINENIDDIEVALRLIYGLHLFFGSASGTSKKGGYREVSFVRDNSKFDKILKYKSLEESMDEFYLRANHQNVIVPQKKENNVENESQDIWNTIENEFDISKRSFGKKINFVKDKFKRDIIFRDVSHSFQLAEMGFAKPSVILSGAIIEELLRLYLQHHKKKPDKETFDGYIQCCEKNGLIKKGISRLSDSVRHFRNLVHISREDTKRSTISKATAKGAVASIFTIVNDF